jgi:hypothetical protein
MRMNEKEKIFCLISGIEGPNGLPMLNPQFFPLGEKSWGKFIATVVLGGAAIFAAAKIVGIF